MCTFVLIIVELIYMYQTVFLLKSRFVFIDKHCLNESSKNTCTTAGDFEKGMYRAVTTGAFVLKCQIVCLFVCCFSPNSARECFTRTEIRHQL